MALLCDSVILVVTILAIVQEPCCANDHGADFARNISVKENPNCTEALKTCPPGSLFHIRSDSRNDSLHFVWNFFGCPTLLIARTTLNTTLEIDWVNFIEGASGSVTFNPPDIYYSFGWSLNSVFTFTDVNDTASMENQTDVFRHSTSDFHWTKDGNDSEVSEELIKFSMRAVDYDGKSLGKDGYMKITVQIRNKEGYGTVLPYLRHNGNSSQVDISLNKVDLNNTMTPKTRIGLGYILVQQVGRLTGDITAKDKMVLEKTKSLDDEHSPGVFEMFSIRTPIMNEYDQGYLEWKPISYTGIVRDIQDSVDVHVYPLQDLMPIHLDNSLLWSFYGNNISTLIAQSANISFGSQGDGFFNATPHVSWTFMTGYGPTPSDAVSLLVILTLAIGLGIPTLIILFSIIYLFTKRLATPKDDLLLGR